MTFGTGIILDLIFLLVLIIMVRLSAKRGFVRTVVELAGWLALMYVAFSMSQPLAEGIYAQYVHQPLYAEILRIVEQSLSTTAAETSTKLWDALPGFVQVGYGMMESGLQITVGDTISGGAAAIADALMTAAVTPLTLQLIRWSIIALVFGVGMWIVRALARFLNRLFNLPIIGTLNRTLGGVIGFVKGLVVVLVICILLSILLTLLPEGLGPVDRTMLNTSYVFQFLDKIKVFSY